MADLDFYNLYDDNGSLIQRTRKSDGSYEIYTWNHRGKMTSATAYSPTNQQLWKEEYFYDPLGRPARTVSTDGSQSPTSKFQLFDGVDLEELLMELDTEGRITKTVLHGPSVDTVMAEESIRYEDNIATMELSWLLSDHQGTPVLSLAQGASSVTPTILPVRNAYGEELAGTGVESTSSFGFQGHVEDSQTGFTNFRARMFSSRAGRFLSQDPMGFQAGDSNLYRMVGNKPHMATDPSGMVEGDKKKKRKTEQGVISGYFAELAEHHKSSNPIASIYFGMLVGPVTLFDTLPLAIEDSARWAREDIAETIRTTDDPVQRIAGHAAYSMTYVGEAVAQVGNATGASAPIIILAAEVPGATAVLMTEEITYLLASLATYHSVKRGFENFQEGNFSGSDVAFIGMSISPFLRMPRNFSTAADAPSSVVERSGAGLSQALPRTANLPSSASMADILSNGWIPGREGITISDRLVRFGDMFKMSKASGVEFGLTRETIDGRMVFRLYSGGGDNVRLPGGPGTRIIGHTHPRGTRYPSTGEFSDMDNINRAFLRSLQENPAAPLPHRRVIWGDGDFDSTLYFPDVLR